MGNICVGSRGSKDGFRSISNSAFYHRSSAKMDGHRGIASQSMSVSNVVKQKEDTKATEQEKHIVENRVPPSRQKEDVKPEGPTRPKKSLLVKEPSSAGLIADSVLRTKSGHLKEYFNLGRKLGHGNFGTIFLCVEKATGTKYACKSIAKSKMLTSHDVEDVRREVEIMHHLAGHPNVISIKGVYEDSVAVHVVMELCVGGELVDRILKRGHYAEQKAARLARTIVGVVEACHSLQVMHRDLKPENFLFVNEKEDSPLKMIDFGLSTFFKPGETFTNLVGSANYIAPEVLQKSYGPEADIWSAGVIIYVLLSGAHPFWGETEKKIFEEVLHGDLDFSSDPWPNISESAKDLVRRMLVRNPNERITAYEVLCHPWLRVDGVAPEKPLDCAVWTRLKQFSAMNKFKKMALRDMVQRLSEEGIAGTKEISKMIDTANRGHITFEELKAGLTKFGANFNEPEMLDLLKAASIDNSGTIDFWDFVAATLQLNKVEKEAYLLAAFSHFDRDGSGYITQDELQQAFEEFSIEDVRLEEMILYRERDGRIDYNELVAMMQTGNTDQRDCRVGGEDNGIPSPGWKGRKWIGTNREELI
ncbi:hypothetical protein BT93_L1667 [Corymbia citriodora subsp. variegata]|uniref:non-specific serine/threonine protein kinase n=1 Tax=Corymbia citriodora subsp. variegata TaxID=360336 RepID=A0A8T0CWI8_CORYI|nr:hypothetical protein BT93_L1667 [Corymbia citriodora subsp. variegata]